MQIKKSCENCGAIFETTTSNTKKNIVQTHVKFNIGKSEMGRLQKLFW
jgi:hypothetical protein